MLGSEVLVTSLSTVMAYGSWRRWRLAPLNAERDPAGAVRGGARPLCVRRGAGATVPPLVADPFSPDGWYDMPVTMPATTQSEHDHR